MKNSNESANRAIKAFQMLKESMNNSRKNELLEAFVRCFIIGLIVGLGVYLFKQNCVSIIVGNVIFLFSFFYYYKNRNKKIDYKNCEDCPL